MAIIHGLSEFTTSMWLYEEKRCGVEMFTSHLNSSKPTHGVSLESEQEK
jgi:hypothetical protein